MTAVPQKYIVHCLVNEACDCAAVNSPFNYYMFMEGSVTESAVQYCNKEPSLSCFKQIDSNDATTVDNQLTVTWYAKTVITQGYYNYHTTNTTANGNHDFLCAASFNDKLVGDLIFHEAFVSIRGIYMHFHACKCQKLLYYTITSICTLCYSAKFHPF